VTLGLQLSQLGGEHGVRDLIFENGVHLFGGYLEAGSIAASALQLL